MKHIACVLFFAISFAANAQTGEAPNTISYQGLLTTTLGTPVPDGMYKLQFDVFTVPTAGVSLWTEVDSQIAVVRGTFNVILGNGTPLPAIFAQQLYLQVTAQSGPGISGPTTFSPRSPLASASSALTIKTPLTLSDSVGANMIDVSNRYPGQVGRALHAFNSSFTAIKGESPYWIGVGGTTDTGAGVEGISYSTDGAAFQSINVGAHGWGILAANFASTGYAAEFDGRVLITGAPGDSAVQLPDNSISAHEILDEPGIAQGIHTYGITPGTSSSALTDVDSATITIPAAGYVVVEAAALAVIAGGGAGQGLDFQIDSLRNGGLDLTYYFVAGFDNSPTGRSYLPVAPRRTFYRQAGTYTFYFAAYNVLGTTNYLWNPVITATYYPKSYGPVQSVIGPTEVAKFSGAEAVTPDTKLPPPGAGSGSAYAVDLRDLEIKAEKARAEAERAQRQLAEAKLRRLTHQ